MLTIKLRRIGKKNQPSYRIIVLEKRSKITGRYVEDLGWLNPKTDELNIKKERAEHWLKNGAQPTDTVYNLLVKSGVIAGPKRAVHAKSKKEAPAPVAAEEKTPAVAETVEETPVEKEESVPEEKEEKTEEKPAEEVSVDKE